MKNFNQGINIGKNEEIFVCPEEIYMYFNIDVSVKQNEEIKYIDKVFLFNTGRGNFIKEKYKIFFNKNTIDNCDVKYLSKEINFLYGKINKVFYLGGKKCEKNLYIQESSKNEESKESKESLMDKICSGWVNISILPYNIIYTSFFCKRIIDNGEREEIKVFFAMKNNNEY